MKKYSLLIFLTMLVFTSCILITGGGSGGGNKTDGTQSNETVSSVLLQNNSIFTAKVYSDSLRETEVCTLKANESKLVNSTNTSLTNEIVYYVTYYVNVGVEVPWYSNSSYIVAVLEGDKTATSKIENPSAMSTQNCYILLENNSKTNIAFKQGSSELYPDNDKSSTLLVPGKSGAYEIKYAYFNNFPSFKISATDGKTYNFPSQMVSFESGKIYSLTVTDSIDSSLNVSLKSVTPFDINVSKQIWNFDDKTFVSGTALLRPAYNISDGSLIMGTDIKDKTKIGLKTINKFNTINTYYTVWFNHDNSAKVINSRVLDFVQQQNGSIVILLENEFEKNNVKDVKQILACYNFEDENLEWVHYFDKDIQFRLDSKNKLFCTNDGKIAVCGSVIYMHDTGLRMHRYFAILYEQNGQHLITEAISQASTDFSDDVEMETMFTSIWYDGNDFYVCGYDNCDFKYENYDHKGIIWRYSGDLSESELVYENPSTLFLCIDGIGDKWYACGEYFDNGRILKGCYVSSDMVAAQEAPVKYVVKSLSRSYCYFTQMCCYDNKLIVAGKASNDFYGLEESFPVILAFDKNTSTILWENTSFTKYTDIGGIIPNPINTYVIQLLSGSSLHYVSANLLGEEN